MKKTLLLLVFMGAILAFGQITPPNYKKIEKAVADKNSELYYPKLLERYQTGDTTFTTEELQHLYYGFVFQKNYHPYENEDSKLKEYLKGKEGLNDEECLEVIKMAKEVLKKNPFKVSAINTLSYCYDQLDSMDLVKNCDNKTRAIALAIISSGNGMGADKAFFVNEIGHEYFILSLYGLFPEGQSLETKKKAHYDVLNIAENEYGLKKLYFNIDSFYGKLF